MTPPSDLQAAIRETEHSARFVRASCMNRENNPDMKTCREVGDSPCGYCACADSLDAMRAFCATVAQREQELQQTNARLVSEAVKDFNDAEDQLASVTAERDRLREAVDAVLAEPYGCGMCDSGKLRTPNDPRKDHFDDCPYVLLRKAIAASPAPQEPTA